jgi:hypothetical protein
VPTYRCYFLNKADAIVAVEEIECAGEEDARQAALRLLRERPGYAVEVWDRARKILRQMREPA